MLTPSHKAGRLALAHAHLLWLRAGLVSPLQTVTEIEGARIESHAAGQGKEWRSPTAQAPHLCFLGLAGFWDQAHRLGAFTPPELPGSTDTGRQKPGLRAAWICQPTWAALEGGGGMEDPTLWAQPLNTKASTAGGNPT